MSMSTYRALIPRNSGRRFTASIIGSTTRATTKTTTAAFCHHQYSQGLYHGKRAIMTVNGSAAQLRLKNPAIFVCDMQEKFAAAIYEFDKIALTTKKLLIFASHFSLPVHTTCQTPSKLGPTVPSLAALLPSPPHEKTLFSMAIPSIKALLPADAPSSVALVGIESHICITQTALDLRDLGHKVYIIADGVSSCNREEVVVALDRLRAEQGITVTTSESWMYECVGDATHPSFRKLLGVVKESSLDTKKVLAALPPKI